MNSSSKCPTPLSATSTERCGKPVAKTLVWGQSCYDVCAECAAKETVRRREPRTEAEHLMPIAIINVGEDVQPYWRKWEAKHAEQLRRYGLSGNCWNDHRI